MKKNKIIIVLGIILGMALGIKNVNAASYDYSFVPYNVTSETCMDSEDAAFECFERALDGDLDQYLITNSQVEKGMKIMVLLHIRPSSDSELVYMRLKIDSDPSKISLNTNLYNLNDSPASSKNPNAIFPLKSGSSTRTAWTISDPTFLNKNGLESAVSEIMDDQVETPLVKEGTILALYYTVSENVSSGENITISFDKTMATLSNPENIEIKGDATFNDLVLTVASNVSKIGTLNTLTATGSNNLDYPFSFVPDSDTDLEYSFAVPNAVDSIVLSGTPTDASVKNITNMNVLSGPLETPSGDNPGTHALNVGDNTINIVVTAESGDTTIYKINVKRLSNDTSITSVTGTNGIAFNNINDTANSITVPYKTASSDITVTLTDANAFLDAPIGSWTINSNGNTDTTNNYTILVKSEECKAEYASIPGNGNCTTKSYPFEIIRTAPSKNVNLASLEVDGVTVPGFDPINDPDKKEFTLPNVSADKESVVVTATLSDTLNSITTGTGTQNIKIGDNQIIVTVLSEDNVTKKEYIINIHRLSNETKLATINGLEISSTPSGQFTPNFVNTFNDYTYTYPANVGDITIKATVLDTDKASVSIIDMSTSDTIDNSTKTLNTATNTFNKNTKKVGIIVTAEDGTTGLYTVNFTRLTSSNNMLKSLSITPGTGLKETFEPTKTTYTAEVDSDVTSVTVNAEASDETNKGITISGNTNLQFGANTITVRVVAENGQPLDYIITVTRKRSSIASLDAIRVGFNGSAPSAITGFNKDTFSYELTTKTSPLSYNTTSATIEYDKTDEFATVTGDIGTIDLTSFTNKQLISDDNGKKVYEYTFKITVTPQDGSANKIYTLKTYKEANNNTDTNKVTVHNINATLDPSDTTNSTYKVEVENNVKTLSWSDISVTLNETTSLATPITTGTINLSTTNDNTFDFLVTSESGETKNYQIIITRKKSNNNTLTRVNLFLGEDTVSTRFCEFQSNTNCTIEVPTGTSAYRLEAVLPESATVSPVNETKYTMSSSSIDSIQVKELTVTAEDGTTKKYTVTVKRLQSSNNLLEKLETNANSETLTDILGSDKVNPNRSITVPSTQTTIKIHAEAQDGTSTITSNKYTGAASSDITFDVTDLKYGSNLVTITVTSENNQPKIYNLTIIREDNTEPRLSMITIDGNSIDDYLNGTSFDADPSKDVNDTNYVYNLNMFENNVTSILLDATHMDTENGSISGTGNKTIETIYHGTTYDSGDIYTNTFVIRSFAHNKTIYKDYTINITRKANSEVTLKDNAVSMNYDGVDHIATWNSTDELYEITVPNKVNVANSTNVKVTVPTLPSTTDTPAKVSMNETTLKTDDEINHNVNTHKFTVTAEDGTTKEYTMKITRELSNNAYLKSISILNPDNDTDIGSWTPSFADGIITYSVSVPVSTTDIKIAAEIGESHQNIISGLGTFTLASSNETFNIVVMAEDGTQITYALNIIREQSRINSLKSLKIKDLEENEFTVTGHADERNRFSVTIPGTVDKIKFEAISDSALATITYLGVDAGTLDTYTISNKGVVTKEFTITSESGAEQKYYVEVTKLPKTDATLKKLTYKFSETDIESEITLQDNLFEYTIPKVSNETKTLILNAELTDTDASIVSGIKTHNLKTGNNVIGIETLAEDGKTKLTYQINIEREKSSNAYLSNLEVLNQTINEALDLKNTFHYTIDVTETTEKILKSDITATAEDENSTVTLDEDLTLVSGKNTYTILVTAEDGTELTYYLEINKPKSTDALLKSVNLNGATLKETFNPNDENYTIIVPFGTTEFTIEGIPNHSLANVDGNNTYQVDTTSSVTLTVHPEDENAPTKTYNFVVEVAASNVATLSTLSVVDYPFTDGTNEVPFESDKDTYSIGNILKSVNKLVVNAGSTNTNATITYFYDNNEITACHNNTTCDITLDNTLGAKNVEVRVLAADNITTKTYTINYTKVNSNNNNLSKLEAFDVFNNALSLSEPFKPEVTSYKISIPNDLDSVRLDVSKEDNTSTVTINGDEILTKMFNNLAVGKTTVTIIVTAQNGTEKTYTIDIERADYTASTESDLTDLKVFDVIDTSKEYALTPNFGTALDNHYSIGEIPYNLASLNIVATKKDTKANIKYFVNGVEQVSNEVTLPNTSGTILVEVTAEDNTTKTTYEIAYTKTPSNNAFLSNITVSEGTLTPSFGKEVYEYTVDLSNDLDTVDFIVTSEHSGALIKINGEDYVSGSTKTLDNLPVGETSVTIVVTAEDGNSETYVVKINRADVVEEKITSITFGHTINDDYILSVTDEIAPSELKDQLDNENSKLFIYQEDGITEIAEDEYVGTGMVIKLIIDGVEKDSKTIVVLGDVNGDGIIDPLDSGKIINHYLERTELLNAYAIAGDINIDGEIDPLDSGKVINHYLERSFIHPRPIE